MDWPGPIKQITVKLPESLHAEVKSAAPKRSGTVEKAYQQALEHWLFPEKSSQVEPPLPRRPFHGTDLQARFDEIMLHGSGEITGIVEAAINASFGLLKAGRKKAIDLEADFHGTAALAAEEEDQERGNREPDLPQQHGRPARTSPIPIPRKRKAR